MKFYGWFPGFYKQLTQPLSSCLLFAVISATLAISMQNSGILQAMELRIYDELLMLRPVAPIDNRIIIIGETEADIRRYGHPLADEVLATAIEYLERAQVRVIGIDKYRDIPVNPGSDALNSLLKKYENVVCVFFSGNLSTDSIAAPQALADKPEQTGFSNLVEDADGILRRGLLFLDVNGNSYYAFSLLIALHYLAAEHIEAANDDNNQLSLNGISLPAIDAHFGAYQQIDSSGYQIMLDYPGLAADYPGNNLSVLDYRNYTLSDLLYGKITADVLRDKIVILGGTTSSLQDMRILPNKKMSYGVEQHAYFVSQLLNTAIEKKPLLAGWSETAKQLWIVGWCLCGVLVGCGRKFGVSILAGLMMTGLVALAAATYYLFRLGWWLPFIAPLIGGSYALLLTLLYFSSKERAERGLLMRLFASHVSPEVANRLWSDREQFFRAGGVHPDTLTATVMFTDLCNFTRVAENMEPLLLMKWLNEYMDEMSGCIIQQGGIINKYIGDAIMAVFGVPIKRDTEAAIADDAIRAVQCATEFSACLRKLNDQWQAQGLPVITMRVGIHTGALVAGSLGGHLRMEYTVIGDTVNTASRLESFDKLFAVPDLEQPCRILIGETTYDLVRQRFQTREVGECRVKGKEQFLKIYQVLIE